MSFISCVVSLWGFCKRVRHAVSFANKLVSLVPCRDRWRRLFSPSNTSRALWSKQGQRLKHTNRALARLYKHWIFTLKFWHSTEYICLKSRQCSSVQLEFRLFFYYLCIYFHFICSTFKCNIKKKNTIIYKWSAFDLKNCCAVFKTSPQNEPF